MITNIEYKRRVERSVSEVCKSSVVRGCNTAVLFDSVSHAIAAPGKVSSKFTDRELAEPMTLYSQVIGINEDMKL